MEIMVKVVSKELIKPSSPTPDHLRHYQLSFFDQISPSIYNAYIYLYAADGGDDTQIINNHEKFKLLGKSLSEVLVHFYPLAGRLKDNLCLDCNDEGICYLQAQVSCKLSTVFENPVPGEIKKLLPFELDGGLQESLLGIQFNMFECGGIGIGICMSHKIGDACSFFTFVNSWAATSRGEGDKLRTQFVLASLFPPMNLTGHEPGISKTKENIMVKRFVFSDASMKALIRKYYQSTNLKSQQPPSRVQVLSTFIWSRVATIFESRKGRINQATLIHLVNLRSKMDPPVPEHSFGNLYWFARTISTIDSREQPFNLVSKVRESIRKIDSEFVKALQNGDKFLILMNERAKNVKQDEMIFFTFSSLCRYPIYDADFGWGKPIWAGGPPRPLVNHVVFTDTASGQGIEALVHLKEEDMAKFQDDKELLQFVSPTIH